jgi:hypothetical protein
VSKVGENYTRKLRLDGDGDGRYEEIATIPTFDLKLVNERDDGVIWLRTLPISKDLVQKDLRVLARNYVDAASGTQITAVQLGPGVVEGRERHFATRIGLLDIHIPALQQALRDATTDCLTPDQRQTYLTETDVEARAGYEACERNHGRTPFFGAKQRRPADEGAAATLLQDVKRGQAAHRRGGF